MTRVTVLAVLAGLIMVVSASGADQRSSALPPPGVRSNPAWLTVTTGPTTASQHLVPQLFAITPTSHADELTPFGFFNDLTRLDASAAVIWAMTIGKAGHPFSFKRAAWPPQLRDFRVDHAWEGQPVARIQQRLFWLTVRGWNLDVRVYFGTQHPSKPLLASVQTELNRLTLPSP